MQFFVSCIRGRPMVAPTYCNPIYTVQTKIYRFIPQKGFAVTLRLTDPSALLYCKTSTSTNSPMVPSGLMVAT